MPVNMPIQSIYWFFDNSREISKNPFILLIKQENPYPMAAIHHANECVTQII